MFKKIKLYLFIIILLIVFTPHIYGVSIIDKSNINNGVIRVNNKQVNNGIIKILIEKDGSSYNYVLKDGSNVLPLTLGNGNYKITTAKLISGKRYRVLNQETINLQVKDENGMYLQSIQDINWDVEMEVIKKAKEITKKAKTDLEKVGIIHNYVISNIRYDYGKSKTSLLDYIPSIEEIDKSQMGICYDFSSLTAAMLRSIGIPTKLVSGYNKDIVDYHSWNQVYLSEADKWITVDTTWDSVYFANNLKSNMIKDDNQYKVKKEY